MARTSHFAGGLSGFVLLALGLVGAALPAGARDVPTCAGMAITLPVGTLVGTNSSDVMLGTAADETIRGGLGRDVICGGGGNDYLFGGDGDDRLFGGDGEDAVDGSDGSDTCEGEHLQSCND